MDQRCASHRTIAAERNSKFLPADVHFHVVNDATLTD
jgi:hypothetical protein